MGLVNEPLFETAALDNLKLYKYSSVDKSPLTKYVLRHWWDLAATFFPMWMAPNLITLAGLGFIILNTLTVVLYLPDLLGPAPQWTYYSFALGLFLYQTFDNVDGRQARRTGSSSALGHIFDHTIDSLNVPLLGLIMAASLGLGNSRRGAFMVLIGLWPMWLSTWEEYYTETLYLSYINGPTEGILIACCVHIISGSLGPTIWGTPCHSLPPFSWMPADILLIDLFQGFVGFAAFVLHAPECIRNVSAFRKQRSTSLPKALLHHTPFIVYNLAAVSWILSPHSTLLKCHNGDKQCHKAGGLVEFALLITFTFGKLGPRVILARLSKSPFPWFNFGAFLPLVGGAIMVNLPLFATRVPVQLATAERWYLHIALMYAFLDFSVWFVTLCRKFMVALDIGCLSIKHRKVR